MSHSCYFLGWKFVSILRDLEFWIILRVDKVNELKAHHMKVFHVMCFQ